MFACARLSVLTIVLGVMCVVSPVQAGLYGFQNITGNNAVDAIIGESQLSVDVTFASGQVLFTFRNSGTEACSITQIYFDAPTNTVLETLAVIDDSEDGVSFSPDASPGHLPGGNTISPSFVITADDFLLGSDPPTKPNGVDPNQSLGVIFDIASAATFANVIEELHSEALRIGIHVQGFDGGGSESFVNTPVPTPDVIPAPPAAALGIVGLWMVGLIKRRAWAGG